MFVRHDRSLLIAILCACPACGSEVYLPVGCPEFEVSEIAAANETYDPVADPAFCERSENVGRWCCEQPDWVELHNTSGGPIDVADLAMPPTSAAPVKLFGSVDYVETIIEEGRYLVVFAIPFVPAEDPECEEQVPPHVFAGIDLDRDGNRVTLLSAEGGECMKVYYPDQHADFSWDPTKECDTRPSPGEDNHDCLCDLDDDGLENEAC
jgi:hypothetical protein